MRPDEKIACLCQHLVEDEGKNWLSMVLNLPDSASALAYVRAAEEIELMVENTSAVMINLKEYVAGEPPPELHGEIDHEKGLFLIGVIRGPRRDQIPEEQRDAVKATFFGECVSILESYGLVEERAEAVS